MRFRQVRRLFILSGVKRLRPPAVAGRGFSPAAKSYNKNQGFSP